MIYDCKLFYIIGFFNYNILNIVLNKFQKRKLAMNSTSMIHACSTSLISLMGNSRLLRMNTGGYFLFDILYLIRNRKINLMNGLYLYHHMAGLYYISLDPHIYNWVQNTGWGEFSNIANYILYYYLKIGDTVNINFWKKIQLVWFGFMRTIIFTYLGYKEFKDVKKRKKIYPVLPLYFLGLIWTGFMVKQNISYLNM